MSSTEGTSEGDGRRDKLWLRTGLLLLWLYVVLLGGTWAVVSSFGVRLLSEVILIALVGGWLIARAWRGQRLPATALDRPILAFLGAMALATVMSTNRSLSVETLLLWIGYALLFYLLVALAAGKSDELIALLMVAGTIVGLGALAELVLWYFGLAPGAGYGISWPSVAPDGTLLPPVWLRPRLVAGNPNVLGGYLAPLVPVGLAVALGGVSRRSRLLAGVWTAGMALATAASISRGSLLAIVAGLAGFGILCAAVRHGDWVASHLGGWRRQAACGGALSLLVIAVIWHFLPEAGPQAGSEGVRVELWGYALTVIQQRPLIGVGPDTFGLAMLQLRPAAARAEDLLPHAHNLYLGLAAELGLLGLAGALWLGLTVGRAWWRAVRAAERRQGLVLTGVMAGLLATATHGLVEDFRIFPLLVIHGMLFVALVVAREATSTARARRRGLPARVLLVPAAGLFAVALGTSFIRWELDVGVRLAGAGRWQEAATYLDAAATQDPGVTFYAFQAALARGWLAKTGGDGGPGQLAGAIDTYRAAIQVEPSYALNHANLAALLWQADEQEQAVSEMARAVALQPAEARYRLNLANYYWGQGRGEAAEREYLALLLGEPRLMRSRAWQSAMASGVDQGKLLARARDRLEKEPPLARATRRGQLALAADEPEEAIEQFRLAIDRHGGSAEAWSGLGEALGQLGRHGEAADALHRAAASSPTAAAHAALAGALAEGGAIAEAQREARRALFLEPSAAGHLVLARLARQQGKVDEAIGHYQPALAGDSSYIAYSLVAWRRPGIQRDSLPQLVPVGPSRDDAAVYGDVAAYLTEEGRVEEAVEVYRRWLAYDPWARSEVSTALVRLGRKL